MKMLLALAVLLPQLSAAQPVVPPLSSPDAWAPRQTAELVVLDKVRARPFTITLHVGQTGPAGPLTVTLRRCVARPSDLPADSAAFLEIEDPHSTASFRGWMLTNEPSLGQFEHPIYDVRLTACR